MKKLLGIVVLGLLLISNYSFADCYSDLKTRWDQNKNNSAYNTYDKGWQRNLTGTFKKIIIQQKIQFRSHKFL